MYFPNRLELSFITVCAFPNDSRSGLTYDNGLRREIVAGGLLAWIIFCSRVDLPWHRSIRCDIMYFADSVFPAPDSPLKWKGFPHTNQERGPPAHAILPDYTALVSLRVEHGVIGSVGDRKDVRWHLRLVRPSIDSRVLKKSEGWAWQGRGTLGRYSERKPVFLLSCRKW